MLSNDIEIIQRDSKYFTVILQNEEGEQINFVEGEEVAFSVKKNLKSLEYIIHKTSTNIEDGRMIIYLTPEETNVSLDDNYYYDFQYKDLNNDIYTLAKGTAQVVWKVTNNES